MEKMLEKKTYYFAKERFKEPSETDARKESAL